MGKFFIRPSSILDKQVGQLKKLFCLWDKNKGTRKQTILADPRPELKKDTTQFEGIPNFLAQKKGLNTKFITRRQIVMNRHFTEIISDVLLNEMSEYKLSELGITITSIETKAWNKGVDIYYYKNNKNTDSEQIKLDDFICELRAAITERGLIGRTPNIRFVLDRSIESDSKMNAAFSNLEGLYKKENETQVVEISDNNLKASTLNTNRNKGKFVARSFHAPNDMTNTLLSIDYPKLYDQIAAKMERGRAISARTNPSGKVALNTPPLIRGPPPDQDAIDPLNRIINMQKFLINQRKKTERLGRERRLQQILARDANRWDVPKSPEDNVDSQEDFR